jgi:predicted methyltransferase
MLKQLCIASICILAWACDQAPSETASQTAQQDAPEGASEGAATPRSLDEIIASLPAKDRARVPCRHPKETLEFFGVEPGMTVVDTIPGDVWYTGILAAYLGPQGKIIGADRPLAVWEYFGPDYSPPEFLAKRPTWTNSWPLKQAEKHAGSAVAFDAFAFANAPGGMAGTVDVVMMIREFHNLTAADESNALANTVLGEVAVMLKPGGVFAVIDHRAPEEATDAWAKGANGYIKQSKVIALVEAAGFTLEAASEINANPKDQPTAKEAVWRLPPSLDLPEGDAALRSAMLAIGESDRMTLKFRKNG